MISKNWNTFGRFNRKISIPLKNIFLILLLMNVGWSTAQVQKKDSLDIENSSKKDSVHAEIPGLSIQMRGMDFDMNFLDYTDSLSTDKIRLERVVLVAPFNYKSRAERREYLILKRKTEKVWPYAVLAAERLSSLEKRLDLLESNYDKKVYTRRVQKYMENQFTDQLKDLTKTEGQILVKLLNRQTGETTYEIIRDLRTGWRAFRYNLTAGLFTISLKEEYNPLENREDYYIEHILRRGIQMGDLEHQAPSVNIDYDKVMEKWE